MMRSDAANPRFPNPTWSCCSTCCSWCSKKLLCSLSLCAPENGKVGTLPMLMTSFYCHGLRMASKENGPVICYCQAKQPKVMYSKTEIFSWLFNGLVRPAEKILQPKVNPYTMEVEMALETVWGSVQVLIPYHNSFHFPGISIWNFCIIFYLNNGFCISNRTWKYLFLGTLGPWSISYLSLGGSKGRKISWRKYWLCPQTFCD